MSRPAPEIRLTTEEKDTLLRWMRSSKTEQRMVQRARVRASAVVDGDAFGKFEGIEEGD